MRKSAFLMAFVWAMLYWQANAVGQIITDDVPVNNTSRTPRANQDNITFIILNVGMAAPAGAYGSNNILDVDAGFATPGLNVHLNVGHTFNRYIGITATGGYIMQNIRLAEIVDNLNRFNPNQFIHDYSYKGMRYLYAAGGLLITIPASRNFSIDLKLQGGVAFGTDNELTFRIEDATGFYTEKYGKAKDMAFLPDVGLNFRLLVTENLTVNFFTDFVMANFEFKNVPFYQNGIPLGSFDYPLQMRNMNVGLGVGYHF